MKIFLAGATGAIGKRLLPMLVSAGHAVTGTTAHPANVESIRAAGATPAVMNALDARDVRDAVERAKPEIIIHQLTAIPASINLKRFDEDFAMTNRLRTEGTDHLLAAARAVGCRRFIAQSFGAWLYERDGNPIKSEKDALVAQPEPECRKTFDAIGHLESAVLGERFADEGFLLRYGFFYGPGTSIGKGGSTLDAIRKRRMPIVGKGTGYWSFAHVDDAATATVAALGAAVPGIYNVSDDEPAPVSEWLPFLAQVLGAEPPQRVPALLARAVVGSLGIAVMTKIRGLSNQKAKSLLGWKPKWPTWREGFRDGLEDKARTAGAM